MRDAQLCQEIEKKAVLVREQQAEFQRVHLAYAQARFSRACHLTLDGLANATLAAW